MSALQEVFHGIMSSGAVDDFAKIIALPAAYGIKILTDKYAPLIKRGWILYFREKDNELIEIDKKEED